MKNIKIYATTMSSEAIKGKSFTAKTIIITLETGTMIACQSPEKIKRKLPVWVYSVKDRKWYRSLAEGEISDILIKYHYRYFPKKKKCRNASDPEMLMRHERKKKKGGGSGVRLDKENFRAGKTITDYECSGNPMHDFRRVYV